MSGQEVPVLCRGRVLTGSLLAGEFFSSPLRFLVPGGNLILARMTLRQDRVLLI